METVIRITLIYLFVFAGLRVLGKREFGQLSPIELVTLLLIPEIVSQAMVKEDFSLTNGFIGIATIFLLVFLNSVVTHVSHRFEKIVQSEPTVLVHHGNLIARNLNRERVSPDEVQGQLRMAGLERLEQVKWAILESDGKISIVPEPGADRHATTESRTAL
jgi:uncharacterized membrane protein YcaP (DUF421 family)